MYFLSLFHFPSFHQKLNFYFHTSSHCYKLLAHLPTKNLEVYLAWSAFTIPPSAQNSFWPKSNATSHFFIFWSPFQDQGSSWTFFFLSFCFFKFFKISPYLHPSLTGAGAPSYANPGQQNSQVLCSHTGSPDLWLLLHGIFHSWVQGETRWQWQVLCHSLFSTKQKMTGNANCFSDDKFPSNVLL